MYKHFSEISYKALCGDTVPEIGLSREKGDVNCPRCLEELEKPKVIYVSHEYRYCGGIVAEDVSMYIPAKLNCHIIGMRDGKNLNDDSFSGVKVKVEDGKIFYIEHVNPNEKNFFDFSKLYASPEVMEELNRLNSKTVEAVGWLTEHTNKGSYLEKQNTPIFPAQECDFISPIPIYRNEDGSLYYENQWDTSIRYKITKEYLEKHPKYFYLVDEPIIVDNKQGS